MSYTSSNIKHLRIINGLNQAEMGALLNCSRDNIASYERGSEPKLDFIFNLVNYFHIPFNDLVKTDLSVYPNKELITTFIEGNITDRDRLFVRKNNAVNVVEPGNEDFVLNEPEIKYSPGRGDKTQLIPQIITVDHGGDENILYVPVKAAAGYLNGYADPVFLERLPSFNLPGLRDGTFRAFEVGGDSMYPTLHDKEMVIGQWVEKLDYIREDRVHILVTKTDGVIVKRLLNRVDKYGYIVAKSDAVNDRNLYPNIEVFPEDILEVWYGVWHGGFNFKAPGDMWKRQNNLEADMTEILRRLNAAGL